MAKPWLQKMWLPKKVLNTPDLMKIKRIKKLSGSFTQYVERVNCAMGQQKLDYSKLSGIQSTVKSLNTVAFS